MNHLSKWGFGLTVIYLILLTWLISNRVGQLLTIPLNELGDFLAGAFGPLAIFWLIVGFFQQGKELQQSTEALKLQAKELNNSVLQQEKLAKVTNEALAFEKENVEYERSRNLESIKPFFTVVDAVCSGWSNGNGKTSFRINVINTGGEVLDVRLSADKESNLSPKQLDVWNKSSLRRVELYLERGLPRGKQVSLSVKFIDAESRAGEQVFIARFTDNGLNTSPSIEVQPK